MNKWMEKIKSFLRSLNEPDLDPVIEHFCILTRDKIQWNVSDTLYANSFFKSTTGIKLLRIIEDAAISKKTEIATSKDDVMYIAGLGDGMINALARIKSLSFDPQASSQTEEED